MKKSLIIISVLMLLFCVFALSSCKGEDVSITFVDSDVEVQTITAQTGTKIAEPQEPSKYAHSFLGWYNGDTKWDFNKKVKGAMTLVAKWELTTYTITYDCAGQNSPLNKTTFTVNDLPVRLYDAQNVDNSYFLGWEQNGTRINRIINLGNVSLVGKYESESSSLIVEEYDDHVVLVGISEEEVDIVVPKTYNGKPITKIKESAFESNESILSLTITGNITTIGKNAFKGCKNLKKISLGPDMKVLEESCFMDCTSIYEIYLPEKLEYLGNKAFKGCKQLTDINLPDGLKYLGEDFILDCEYIVYDIYENEGYQDKYIDNWLIEYANREARSLVFKEGTVGIASYAFYQMANLRTIVIPQGVKYIGSHAFFFCYNVTVVTLNEDLEFIGMYAFYRLQKLSKITIPRSVTTIGMKAFEKCVALTITCEAEDTTNFGLDWNGEREVIYVKQDTPQ